MCPDETQYRQETPDAPDATRCGAWVQDAQDVEFRLGESGCNMSVSDPGHLFADAVKARMQTTPDVNPILHPDFTLLSADLS